MVKQLNYKVEISPREFPVVWEPLMHFFQHLVWCNIRKILDEGRKNWLKHTDFPELKNITIIFTQNVRIVLLFFRSFKFRCYSVLFD